VEQPTYQGSWAFWQHTDCGRVDGVRGLVDCDVFNGTPEEFQSLLIKEL
jgi:lysozyme